MARLNEPTASTETMDSLKRKFMRQNRDIARANSAQGLRIRNLENETSRLLSENLDLREQIIRLKKEVEGGKAQRIADHSSILRAQLEEKLMEIGNLIGGLGREPTPKKKSPQAGKLVRSSPSQSPSQKNWKNMCTMSEAVHGQDGRLPPILENKSYPRRTLERQEILDLVANAGLDSADSPDIGPPPMSQFVDQDPVKIDLPRRTKKEDSEELASLDPVLSVNLEQRRKRKDSIAPADTTQVTKTEGIREVAGSLKVGAKRKLSVREDDDNQGSRGTTISPDEFKFTRVALEDRPRNKPATQSERSTGKTTTEAATGRGASRERKTLIDPTTNRRVLAPKSVNDSPRKNLRRLATDEVKLAKEEIKKSNPSKEPEKETRQEPVLPSIEQVALPPVESVIESTIIVQPEPETPACVDIFSPVSSQPSTTRVESRDTPPPQDLGNGIEGQRPSRRARAAVSYAEPNLRDKMRRPTKELVDAVARDDKASRASSVKLEEDGAASTIKIKSEPEADNAWKQMPVASADTVENSPLSSKAPESLPTTINTHRKRRESILNSVEVDAPKSTSGSTMSALLAESRRAKAAAREKAIVGQAALNNAMSKLDVYDFRGSSPQPEAKAAVEKKEEIVEKVAKTIGRVPSRRHTAIARDAGAAHEESEASDMEAAKKPEVSTRRRQSTLGLRSSGTTNQSHMAERTVKRSNSATTVADSVGTGDSRTDRASARRRSMMI